MLTLTTPSVQDAKRLKTFLTDAGYSEPSIRKHLGRVQLPSRAMRNEARLLDCTRERTTLNTLLRSFWLGHPIEDDLARETLPDTVLQLLLQTNLLHRDADLLIPNAILMPIDGFLVASDHPSTLERNETGLVLWPNPTSRFLGRFRVKKHSRATLDLGAGCGILSLWAAGHSDAVVATDLNPRAASFVEFNARLNGFTNITALTGESFQPVHGRTFDLILCNPPFFITPRSEYLFCDNPLDLDDLCRQLAQAAGPHLNEGGYLQMLCEWAEVDGQPWEDRIAEWLQGTGCDAWVMKGMTQPPEEYAQERIREKANSQTKDAEMYDGYMAYYRERKVVAIHDGLIVMRKRTGSNWIRIEEVPKTATGELGELVVSTFAAQDLLRASPADDQLMHIRPKLAANVRLEQIARQEAGQWKAETLTLRLVSGLSYSMPVQPLVAEFLVSCDGERTVHEIVERFAQAAGAPLETVQTECLALLRKLIDRGFVVPNAPP